MCGTVALWPLAEARCANLPGLAQYLIAASILSSKAKSSWKHHPYDFPVSLLLVGRNGLSVELQGDFGVV
jgi:hypothetical protein